MYSQHKNRIRFFLYSISAIVLMCAGLYAQTPITLYNSFSGTINYTVIGGTLRTASNTVNACAVTTSSSYTLAMPSGATVLGAYLYWCSSNTTPDSSVTLNGTTVAASRAFTCANPSGNGNILSSGFADVTSLVTTTGNGLYTFSGLTINTGTAYCNVQNVCGGWGLVVVYNKSTEYRHTVNIYDGFQAFYGSQIIFSPNNFYVPYSRVDGKLTHITWEGDYENSASLNGYSENLGFDGQILSDAMNPVNNQFNSASSALNSDSTWGVDIDTYDITNYLQSGDTIATSVYSSGGDAVWLSCEVISISDTANSDVAITKTCSATGDSIVVGNQMHYYLVAKNNGPDTTGTITVVDTLQPGAKLVSVSASGWQVDSSASPIYTFRHTGAHAPNTTLPTIDMTVYVYYDPSSYPMLRNSASVSSPQFDRRPWNNSATKTIKIVTPVFLQTTKTFYDYRGYPNIGDTLRYIIRVKNSGNWDVSPAHSNPITVVDSLPAGFAYITGAGGTAPTNVAGNATSGYILTWTNVFTTLVQGASDSVRYWVRDTTSSFTGNTLFINTAHVRAAGVDQVVKDTAIPPPIVTITKYYDPGDTKALDTIQYHLLIKNTSLYVPSTSTWVRDTIPSSDTVRTGWADKGGVLTGTTTQYITWSYGTLAPGAVDTLSFKAKIKYNVVSGTAVTNTARDTNAQRYKGSGSVTMYVYQYATGHLLGTSTIMPNDTIFYTLVDEDLNTSTTTKQTITLTDSNKVTNEYENIVLTETGVNTGVFTGKIATVYGASAGTNNNGIFNVKPGDSLRISYTDVNDSTGVGVNRLKTWTTKVVGGHTATIIATASIKPGSTISYTLTDADLNNNPAAIETYVLRDTCKRTSELENITFTERSANDSVFTGSIATVYGTVSDGNNNGHFAVQAGDSIIIKYLDTVNSSGANGGWIYARTYVKGGATALLSTTSQIQPWDSVQVTITDADLNRNQSAIESYTVRDSNMVNHQYQDVIVSERSANDSVFIGYLHTRYGVVPGANNQGYIYVHQGDSLIVTYKDTMNNTGGSGSTLTATTKVLGGNPGTLVTSKTQLYPGDSIQVTVTDRDLNYNTGSIESYTLIATNLTNGQWANVTVTERAANDSVFIGWIKTLFGTTAGSNGGSTLNVQRNDSLTISYTDSVSTDGAPGVTTSKGANILGGNTATLIGTATISPRDTIYYTLTDADLNKNSAVAETYTLQDTCKRTGELETLTFTETGVNTGIFTRKIATTYGTTSDGNNNAHFRIQAGDTLVITYRDTLQYNGGSVLLSWSTAVKGGMTGTIAATPTFMAAGDTSVFTLTDADLNKDTTKVENYNLTLISSKNERETIKFVETGIKTGIFKANIATISGTSPGANGDSVFTVQPGDSVIATYHDSLTVTGDTANVKASVKIGSVVLSSSTKSIVDINGGSAMPPDTMAYTIKVKNTGTVTSTRVAVIDTIPVGMIVLTGTLPSNTTVNGRVITFSKFNLNVNDSLSLQYSLRIDSTIQNGVAVVNIAHIQANGVDQKLTASFTPTNNPLMSLTKSVDKSHAKPGDTLTYTVTYKNVGTSNATFLTVTDPNPSHTTYVANSVKLNGVAKTDAADADEVTYSGGIIQISVGTVLPGQSGTIIFKVIIN